MAKKKPAPKRPAARPAVRAKATPKHKPNPLHKLLAELPALTPAERAAFRSRYTDAQCDALGVETRSDAVAKDAQAWLVVICKTLREHPRALRRYGAKRAAYLAECTLTLLDAMKLQKNAGSSVGAGRIAEAHARARALAVRDDLVAALEPLAGGEPFAREALASARGSAGTDAALASAVNELAAIAEGWLEREDATSRALVASVDLSMADVDDAKDAAAGLEATGAEGDASWTTWRDAPGVNRVEGRVVFEMRVARRAFERAHERDHVVPRLVPGAAIRRVFVNRDAKDADADEVTPGSEAASGTA